MLASSPEIPRGFPPQSRRHWPQLQGGVCMSLGPFSVQYPGTMGCIIHKEQGFVQLLVLEVQSQGAVPDKGLLNGGTL